MARFNLPANYVERGEVTYFDDAPFSMSELVHQPEVYQAAAYLVTAAGRTTVIDVGCGNGRKLQDVQAGRRIGVDFGANIQFCREHWGSCCEWIEADLSNEHCLPLSGIADETTVVICADVLEHMLDPRSLVTLLAACYRRGAIVITSTPDRLRVRGSEHNGPPPNLSHIREWALEEYVAFLNDNALPAIYAGYTYNNNIDKQLKTIITVHDCRINTPLKKERPRPIAIISIYNEEDVIEEVVTDMIDEGCDVVAIDNWSTDRTWNILSEMAVRRQASLQIERFPGDGPDAHYEWRRILHRKETIARRFPGRWIIHSDADEIRRSPFPPLTLADALHVAEAYGANRVSFNLLNFRPTSAQEFRPGRRLMDLGHFEYGTRPGHFWQAKAWLQGETKVDLASSGGHAALFPGATEFPYKFLLRHYPIRSAEHGRRKITLDRQGRWSPEERAMGWHLQYDEFSAASSFLWREDDLHEMDSHFWRDHGLAIMTDIAERRNL